MHPKQFKFGKIEVKSDQNVEQKPKIQSNPKTLTEKKPLKHKFNVV